MGGGGAERVLSTIIDELILNYKITLVLLEDEIKYKVPKDVNLIVLGKQNNSALNKLLNIFLGSYKYAKICNDLNADISFSLTVRSNLINALSKMFGNKALTYLYEVCTPSVQYSDNSMSSKLMKKLVDLLYPKIDRIITNAHGVTLDLKKNCHIKNDIKTVYSPIDIEFIREQALQNNPFFDENATKFISVGRLDSGKNHAMMIKSFANIKEKNSKLYILGDGELREELNTLVSDLNLSKRVIFLGFVSNPFVYLLNADIFLFSTRYEGFPTVLIEALACNLPIISTDCLSGPREILANNNNYDKLLDKVSFSDYGVLTPVDNQELFEKAINDLLENEMLLEKYKKNALLRANVYSKQVTMTEMKKILEEG